VTTTFNPVRRNRNIGTAKQGHGRNNRLVIPTLCRSERLWAEHLRPHQVVQRRIRSRDVTFLIEETRSGVSHACSVADIAHVLAHVPSADWGGVSIVVFRQPTRKQFLLRPAWGRIYYSGEFGLSGHATRCSGPAIVLEAVSHDDPVVWPISLRPADALELERIKADGHQVTSDRRRHVIRTTPGSVRATQLYRTLLHEIGHWVDFVGNVSRPAAAGADEYQVLADAYFARAHDEREAFADRYAQGMNARLAEFGIIPFDAR
jgi:hypothetical protein